MDLKKRFPIYICTLITSLLLIVGGCVLFIVWPIIFNHIIDSQLELTPDSSLYPLWKKFPLPVSIDFYFFNWTNPTDLRNPSVKPEFRQVGPYRFTEVKDKANITWHPENGTVSYRRLNTWFIEDKLKHTLQDRITTINPIAVTATHVARDWNIIIKKGLSASLGMSAPAAQVTHTVSEFLFEGYKDSVIDVARKLPFLDKVGLPPWDRFGWFYTRNGSTEFDGVFTMGTGQGSDFGHLYKWNYEPRTPYYDGTCGEIDGSAGELFKPHPAKDSISLFSSDLCRTISLDYVGEYLVDNILGYKYAISPKLLDNGTLFESNKCYCGGECLPSGVMNVSACRFGSPAFASLPHFLYADPYYLNLIDGMKPDKHKHEFYMILEPNTGVPLEVSARLQINLMMSPVPGITDWDNVPKAFIPMLWFEQKVKIPDEVAFKLRMLLNLPVICQSIAIIAICIGLILLLCTIYKVCTLNLCGKKKMDKIMYQEQHIPLNSDQKPQIFIGKNR